YLVFGLLPLGGISCLTMLSYTRTITSLTDQHVNELLQRVGEQADARCFNLFKYLDLMSKFPYVQLSFLQYPHAGQRSTVQEKLELFRINTQSFDRITLYSNQGEIIATTPSLQGEAPGLLGPDQAMIAAQYGYFHQEDLGHVPPRLLLFKRIYDYRDPNRLVGLVCAETSLKSFFVFTEKLGLGPGVSKSIFNNLGVKLFEQHPLSGSGPGKMREYYTTLPLLGWRIVVHIPEKVLYRDVARARFNILAFAAMVAVAALVAGLLFSRRVTRPLEVIIEGTRNFAAGNLDHRIQISGGKESKRLAEAFNTMAIQLKERQTELVQAGKLASLGLLSAGFAHEVRNPLAGIKTSAQVLERRASGARERGLARGISMEVDRLNQLVEELLHFARPRPSRRVPCDLAEITERSLGLLSVRIQKKRVSVDNRVSHVKVLADPDQMIQVVINLLLNALHAVESGMGRINLETEDGPGEGKILKISDNGQGIPRELLGSIFDPFFSVGKEGTGLGLTIVQALLHQNGARVEVESKEGKGTIFTMIFPPFDGKGKEMADG
ncbi:MAG: HAMP domain-containing protein, partial [Deltaproteobacteria bacterium]|nr:HAMP domain-containing protein [Deltaproteobacteria bacterium]